MRSAEGSIIPNAFDEKPVLKLMFSAMIRAVERWRALKITGFESRRMEAMRRALNKNYEEENELRRKPSADMPQMTVSSIIRT